MSSDPVPGLCKTYRSEVPVELAVLPEVGQEAGGCPGRLLTVRAVGIQDGQGQG